MAGGLASAALASAQTLTIAAASDLQAVLPAIARNFEQQTGVVTRLTFGSSGNIFSQLQNGAPFDIFLSADLDYPQQLVHGGQALADTLVEYASGRIVVWARKDAGLAPLVAPASRALRVRVQLDPGFASRARLRPDASVFVIARVPDGPPMPVAVEKHAVDELPFTATLDDSDGPMPMRKLSMVQDVELVARLSASGNAMRQEGDLESTAVRVHLPADHPVELTIGASAR